MNTSDRLVGKRLRGTSIIRLLSLGFALPAILVAHRASAAFIPVNAGPHDYNLAANWDAGNINGIFSRTLTADQVVTFGANTALTTGLTFNFGGARDLTLRGDAGNRTVGLGGNISMTSGAGARTTIIGSVVNNEKLDLNLNGGRDITVNGTDKLNILNVIGDGSAQGEIYKHGTGTLTLSGANTYTGRTMVFRGTLKIDGGDNRLPTGTTLLLGGQLSAATFDLNDNNQTVAGIDHANPGSPANTTITNTSANLRTFTVHNNADFTFTGTIAGKLNLTKSNTGLLILQGTNTYTGDTSITGGVLGAYQESNLGAAAGKITIDGGTLRGQGGTFSSARPITLGANHATFDSSMTLTGIISGTGNLTKTGHGSLTLAGNDPNTYDGDTTIEGAGLFGAMIIVSKDGALGTTTKKTIVKDGATLAFKKGAANLAYNAAEPVSITGKGTVLGVGQDPLGAIFNQEGDNTFAGPVDLANHSSIGAAPGTKITFTGVFKKNGFNLTLIPQPAAKKKLAGVIMGVGDVIVDGPGLVELAADNTYTGPTIVDEGTLQVTNTSGSATSTNTVTINSAGVLSGTGSIQGAVTINDGGELRPGIVDDVPTIGTISLGSTVLNPTAELYYELNVPNVVGSSINDLTNVNGSLALDGILNVAAGANFGQGTYRLFNYTGSLQDYGLSLGSMPPEYLYSIDTSTPYQVNLVVVPEPATLGLLLLSLTALVPQWMRRGRRN